jgi:antitoxin component YwqK of YwqJK toxin-antitoxin module
MKLKNKISDIFKRSINTSLEISKKKKEIKTIECNDKSEFDKIVNLYLDFGWELVDNSFSINKQDNITKYTQVVIWKKLDKKCHIEYFENGIINKIYNSINDKKYDKYLQFHDNGQIKEEENYKDGKRNGKQTSYHKNGNIKVEFDYNNGKIVDGLYIYYDEDGDLSSENNFKDDKKNGKEIGYHKNGNVYIEFDYKDGKIVDGLYTWYDEDGNPNFESNYKDGELIEKNI